MSADFTDQTSDFTTFESLYKAWNTRVYAYVLKKRVQPLWLKRLYNWYLSKYGRTVNMISNISSGKLSYFVLHAQS